MLTHSVVPRVSNSLLFNRGLFLHSVRCYRTQNDIDFNFYGGTAIKRRPKIKAEERDSYDGQIPEMFKLTRILEKRTQTGQFYVSMLERILEDHKLALDVKVLRDIMESCVAFPDLKGAIRVLKKAQDNNVDSQDFYESAIRTAITVNDYETAKLIFKQLQKVHSDLSISLINTMIRAYLGSGAMGEAKELFMNISKYKLTPNSDTFYALIQGSCELYELKKAYRFLISMKKFGVKPTVQCYSCLLSAFAKSNLILDCIELLNVMITKDNLLPSFDIFQSLADVCISVNQFHHFNDVLKKHSELLSIDEELQTQVYNYTLKKLLEYNLKSECVKLIGDMEKLQVIRDNETEKLYNQLQQM